MSHHGRDPLNDPNDHRRRLYELLAEAAATGDALKDAQATLQGEYPDGKLNALDEGALAVMVGHENGKVVMQFHHPVRWIGFTPQQAVEIAQDMIKQARAIATEPLTVKIG